jgi:uncharacterized membrane protein YgdD (TMEM256/DUF423 family)
MRKRWQKPGWILVAAIAIMAVLVLALAPQVHSAASMGWLPVLPLVLFIGVIAPLSLLPSRDWLSLGRRPEAPVSATSFQRPPPLPRG